MKFSKGGVSPSVHGTKGGVSLSVLRILAQKGRIRKPKKEAYPECLLIAQLASTLSTVSCLTLLVLPNTNQWLKEVW